MPKHEFPSRALEIASKAGFITKDIWLDYVYDKTNEGNLGVNSVRRHRNWAWKNLLAWDYFLPHPNMDISNVHIVNKKKRVAMSSVSGIVANSPYERHIRHDSKLLRGVLEIERAGLIHHWTVEAELKSNERDAFQITSQGERLKYPDAILYWNPPGSKCKLAVELELSLKNKKRYEQIISAYSFVKEVSMILFVTATPAIERTIRNTVEHQYSTQEQMRIGFMRLADWEKNPVNGEVFFGEKRKPLCEFMKS